MWGRMRSSDGQRAPLFSNDESHGLPCASLPRTLPSQRLSMKGTPLGKSQQLPVLKPSEQLFRELVEGAPDAIIVTCGERVAYANPRFLRLLGHPSDDALPATSITELVHPPDRGAFAELEQHVARSSSGAPRPPVEFRLVTSNGDALWVEGSAIVVEFENIAAVLTFVRDISERKLAQAKLIHTDRMATVATLAATVAHELNNPLAYVLLNLALLDREISSLAAVAPDARERLTARLQTLQEGAERMAGIVRDMRAVCRPGTPALAPVDVRVVLESAIHMAMTELDARGRMVRSLPAVPPVLADAAQLGQVFLNLLLNAAQALPENRSAENEVRAAIGVDEYHRVWIEISDTGRGIAPEVRDRIFDPFFTTKPAGIGTGLGLPICQTIVTSMNGEITVESELGQGSRFRVFLPVAPKEPDRKPGSRPDMEMGRRGPRARVLVVDDEALIVTALSKVLEREHDVAAVTSGDKALERLLRDPSFDVILCDVAMPGIGGIELYRALERMRPDLAGRMIFMSGATSMPPIAEFLSSVKNAHIDKPVDLVLLRSLIRKTYAAARD
jgi:PAS domain S-box-containing protein